MTKKKYNKLVRDKIPERILDQGKEVCFTQTHSFNEYVKMLCKKFEEEEVRELTQAMNKGLDNPAISSGSVYPEEDKYAIIEEIVDVLELVGTVCAEYNISKVAVNNRLEQKRKARGSFRKGYILKWAK